MKSCSQNVTIKCLFFYSLPLSLVLFNDQSFLLRQKVISVLGSSFVQKVVIVYPTHGDVMVKMTAHQGMMNKNVLAVNVHLVISGAQTAANVFRVNGFVTEVMIAKMAKMKWTVPSDHVKKISSSVIMESVSQTSWFVTVIVTVLVLMERMNFRNPVSSTVLRNHPDLCVTRPIIAFGTFTSVTVSMIVLMDRTSHGNCAIDYE